MASRLPKYVQAFLDRHGRPRHYFRRRGFAPVALPGMPWSPEFMSAYTQAMAATPHMAVQCKHALGTVDALTTSYLASSSFRSLAPTTQQVYRTLVDAFRAEHGPLSVAGLKPEHVVRMMALRPTPDAANGLRKILRALMKHAVDTGMRKDDPTRDIKAVRTKSTGFHSWNEAEIAQYEARHPIGSRARLAFGLLLFTGQRRSDVVRMGRQHLRDGVIAVRQQKTGVELAIPVLPELEEIIAASPSGQLTFLVTEYGRPFSVSGFGGWFKKQCRAADLPANCSAHGLRKATARRLAEAGCSALEIAAITGHATLHEITRYTKAADQKRLSRSAFEKLKREQECQTQGEGLTKRAKIS